MPILEQLPDQEAPIRSAFDSGDLQKAAELAFTRYGSEILAFLIARSRSRTQGEDAFSVFSEDFWKGLPSFGWQCSLRCWAYKIACNAALRVAQSPAARPQRNLRVSQYADMLAATVNARETQDFRRTEVKRRIAALRERLSAADRDLLMLHVDRGLRFPDLARVLGEAEHASDVEREAARLRKRFERIKKELRRMAIDEGLIAPAT